MFTSLDTFAGSAQDPLSMNRFLYAEANPATLVDPTGHRAKRGGGSAMDYGPQPESCTSYNCTGHPSTVTASTSTDDVREAASHSTASRAYAASVTAQAPAAVMPTFDDAYHQCMSGFAGLGGDAFGGKSCTQTALAQSGASIPESLLRTMLSGLPQFAFMAGGATAIDVAPGLVAAAGSAAADKVVADPAGSARTAGQVICGAVGSCVGGELTVPVGSTKVNPLGGTTNCINCSVAGDAVLSGAPAVALDGPARSVGKLLTSPLNGFTGRQFIRVSGRAEVEEILSDAGPGARGIIYGDRGPGIQGHVFNAANQGGAVNIVDFQLGAEGSFDGYVSVFLLVTNP
jgi:hypothetical protein